MIGSEVYGLTKKAKLNRVPFGKFNRVNSEPVNAYEITRRE